MTTNTPAPLTGDEIRAAVKHAHNMSGPSDATQPAEYVLAGALALLSKLRAPVADDVAAGWKLVPIEPTPDMIEAGATERVTPHASAGHGAIAGYKSMVEKAPAHPASAPVADEPCKRCGGPGWYTNHTTGYPESFPCIACNPQGVSVERLAKDPFLAAKLWRKPAEADGSLLERILEHVGEYGESMVSSALLSVRSIARRNVETRIAAELASAPVADERAAFEKWTGYTEDALSRDAGDGYCIKGVDNQWRAWQARAALASAPVADERDRNATISQVVGLCNSIPGATTWNAAKFMYDEMQRRAALASAPVAGDAQPVAWLHQCRKKPELTQVTMKKHEPALASKGFRPVPLYAAPQASEAGRDARAVLEAWQAVCDRIVDQYGGVVAGVDFAALGRANRAAMENAAVRDWTAILPQPHTDMRYHSEFVRGWNQCLQQVHAALSAQPGASNSDGDDTWKPQTPQQIAAGMRSLARSEGFDWPDPDSAQPGAQKGGSDA